MNLVWQGRITLQITIWPQTTPQTCSAVTLVFRIKSLNHGPYQWCSGARMIIPVWTSIPLFHEWYMRHGPHTTGVDHPTDHRLQTTTWPPTTPQTCSAVTLNIGMKSLNHAPHQGCSSSGPRMIIPGWIRYPTILCGIWGIGHIWQGWITLHTIPWPPTKPRSYSAVTLDIGRTKSLNHGPHQWCSGARMMTHV